jgi:Ca-activated chloride channel family protein
MFRTTARRGVTALLAATATTALLAAPSVAGPATTPLTAQADDAEGRLLLVLDASGSMRDPDGAGRPKIESARDALDAVVSGLAADQAVGLRLFASTVSESNTSAACSDSELVVPIGTGNTAALSAAVGDYRPFGGETPIGHALQEAGRDLGSEGPRSILLVSDGLSTCDPDPCEVAEDLTDGGIDVAVHVVGLDVDSEARRQLQCIAAAGNGLYLDANDTESLTGALTRVSTRAFRPFTISGEPVEGTRSASDAPVLGEGQYTDRLPSDVNSGRYYRIPRTLPRSTVHVGVTMRAEGQSNGSFRLWLDTLDGRTCGTIAGQPWTIGQGNAFGTAGVSSGLYGSDGPCQEDEELVLRVEIAGGGEDLLDSPFEMVVSEEPPVGNLEDLPEKAPQAVWEDMAPGEPAGEVVAGSSLNDAPEVEPGRTYASELTRGEIVFFRVPVGYGQRLQALVEFPQPTGVFGETTGPASDAVDVLIVGPTRGEAHQVLAETGDLNRRAVIETARETRAGATTPEVRWNNRTSGNEQEASLAGDYWVAVSLTSNSEVRPSIPFTITTELVGEVSGVPEYLTAADQPEDDATDDTATETAAPPSRTTDDGTATSEPAAAPATDEEGGIPGPLLAALAALGVALLGAGVVVLTRSLRS